MSESEKKQEERGIFLRFAAAAGLDVDEETIRQPDLPDIACHIRGIGEVAFELTRIDEENELRRMNLFMRSAEFFEKELASLDSATQALLEKACSDAVITIYFREQIDQRARRSLLRYVLSFLASSPWFEGDLRPILAHLPSQVVTADVMRHPGTTNGLQLLTPSAGWQQPVDLERITSKVSKEARRRVAARLELLAYVRWGMSATDDPRDFATALREKVIGSTFARAWIFEAASNRVIAVYENESCTTGAESAAPR